MDWLHCFRSTSRWCYIFKVYINNWKWFWEKFSQQPRHCIHNIMALILNILLTLWRFQWDGLLPPVRLTIAISFKTLMILIFSICAFSWKLIAVIYNFSILSLCTTIQLPLSPLSPRQCNVHWSGLQFKSEFKTPTSHFAWQLSQIVNLRPYSPVSISLPFKALSRLFCSHGFPSDLMWWDTDQWPYCFIALEQFAIKNGNWKF